MGPCSCLYRSYFASEQVCSLDPCSGRYLAAIQAVSRALMTAERVLKSPDGSVFLDLIRTRKDANRVK